ncbi:Signaling threshold-regulating transmembrane adapter 1 [Sciurus carolinensis]|uniref:Signaling threshold-regulating transmembrane adapter 1 n=1 Tax=Sciurus carolinensis TaxID=30640 RepID=A0AA41MD99_SCICA|nr:Signaling threshold-regulating transmembrane adapter 1 [Sciurus carolinensis]
MVSGGQKGWVNLECPLTRKSPLIPQTLCCSSGGSVEEVPLYGNLHYLQTGRLSQEPGPDQQESSPGGPARAAEEVMCYTSLQLRPPQGRMASSATPIKYSEVVLDSESKPQAASPEPELYASVCAQTRRARASFPDQAYANSQPAPS